MPDPSTVVLFTVVFSTGVLLGSVIGALMVAVHIDGRLRREAEQDEHLHY